MGLELQIISPKPHQHFPDIKWNNEELKVEIAKAVADYQNLVVTPETEKDCKDTRAKLNKLRTAIEDARKDMKKRVLAPLDVFEAQVKEVEEPINTAIKNLDGQLLEIKQMKQERKRRDIHEAYLQGKYPEWLKLEQLWNDRWLNVSVSMDQIIKDITEQVSHINANLEVIAGLPEYSFEAEELYKQTLDFKGAIDRAKEMTMIQKRKEAAEAARKAQEESAKNLPDTPRKGDQEQAITPDTQDIAVEAAKQPLKGVESDQARKYTFAFEVTLTKEQATALGMFCRNQGITLTQIQ